MKTTWRFWVLITLLSLAVLGLVARMIDLNVIQRAFLQKQSDARVLRVVKIPAYRGMIVDRNGVALAVSTPVDAVWVNPQLFNATRKQLRHLADLLAINESDLKARLTQRKNSQFVYFKRGVPPGLSAKIRALNIPGVFLQREYKRFYPDGAVAAQVIGFTNIDDNGVDGLELAYNKWLEGVPGKELVVKDRLGRVITIVQNLKSPKQGHDLVLSLDNRIQYLAYRVLEHTVHQFHAQSGSVVVLNAKTGEILAMVNQPSYNPNNRSAVSSGRLRNRAVTDQFEPGSTMKAFSVASALESGEFTPETLIETSPGWMVLNGRTIKDDGNYGTLTVAQVVAKSSNIGVTKMTLSQPPGQLYKFLQTLGFGERTQSDFPGEASGSLIDHLRWRKITQASLSFGYGVAVTTLQLAHAYAIIADHGVKVPVTFLDKSQADKGTQVMPTQIANEMIQILTGVVGKGGTGWRARVHGYQVAGKTGTAYIAGPNGYDRKRYVASFVGFAPVSDPQIVVAVVVNNVQGKEHFGAQVAAPAFAKIMAGSLRLLGIKPA